MLGLPRRDVPAMTAPVFGALEVVVDESLGRPPTPGEDARRLVRHGFAEVLAWLGEEVGPRPGEVVQTLILADGRMYVSPTIARQLEERVEAHQPRRATPGPVLPAPEPSVPPPAVPAWLRRAMCEKKDRYARPEHAVAVAARRVGPRGSAAKLLRVYPCPLCAGWHLTSKTEGEVAGLVRMVDELLGVSP